MLHLFSAYQINDVLIDNAEHWDVVMPMYNLIESSKNYSKTSGSLSNYYRDKISDETNYNNDPNKNIIELKSFKYKTSITGNSCNVTKRIINEEGNEICNPDYDANKIGTKEVELLYH